MSDIKNEIRIFLLRKQLDFLIVILLFNLTYKMTLLKKYESKDLNTVE